MSPLMLSAVPVWVWATLIMAAFAGLTVFTMWLAKFPTQQQPDDPGITESKRAENGTATDETGASHKSVD